jgi:hypothetical protein
MGRPKGGVKNARGREETFRSMLARHKMIRATQSVFQALLQNAREKSGSGIERLLGLPNDTFSMYVRGVQAMDESHLLTIVCLAYNRALLDDDQLDELGYSALSSIKIHDIEGLVRSIEADRDSVGKIKRSLELERFARSIEAVRHARGKAKDQFDKGVARLLKGLMPSKAKAIGRNGTEIRAPRNETEMARNFANWTRRIAKLGGHVTTGKWVHPSLCWVPPEVLDFDEGLSEYDLEQMQASREHDSIERGEIPSIPPPPYHPVNVHRLRLWLGGRDWSPYMHLLEECPTGPGGDDWDDVWSFLDQILERRQPASCGAEVPARAA